MKPKPHLVVNFLRALGLAVFGAALAAPPVAAQEIVVDSARVEDLIKPMFDAFTAKTQLKVKYFTASENELFERVKAQGPKTPADSFMTVDAGNLWLAEHAGLLQGFESAVITETSPLIRRGLSAAAILVLSMS